MVCLMISGRQYEEPELAGSYNVEPDEGDCRCIRQIGRFRRNERCIG